MARGVAVTKEPLKMNSIIEEYLDSPEYDKLIRFHPTVAVKTNLYEDLFTVWGSRIHIRKIIMNLVSNASEVIEGTGNVTVGTSNRYIDKPIKTRKIHTRVIIDVNPELLILAMVGRILNPLCNTPRGKIESR